MKVVGVPDIVNEGDDHSSQEEEQEDDEGEQHGMNIHPLWQKNTLTCIHEPA